MSRSLMGGVTNTGDATVAHKSVSRSKFTVQAHKETREVRKTRGGKNS